MKKWLFCLIRGCMLFLLIFTNGYGARPEPENLPDPRSRQYSHIPWARNYERGTPKVLFIAVNHSAWDIYELAMRMDLEYDVFYTIRPGSFAPTTDYYHEGIKLYPELKQELSDLFEKKWDVIVFVDENPYNLPIDLHYRLIEKIVAGTSVVCFNANRWNLNWRQYPAVKENQDVSLFNTIPVDAFTIMEKIKTDKTNIDQVGQELPATLEMRAVPYKIKPITVLTVGKGKVYTFIPEGSTYWGGPAIHPALHQSPEELLQNEYFYSMAAKLILTAAGIPPAVNIKGISLTEKIFSPGSPVKGKVQIEGAFSGLAELVVRTSLNEVVYNTRIPLNLKGADENFSFNLPGLDAGKYYLDVWLKPGGGLLQSSFSRLKTTNWASTHFVVQEPEKFIESLSLAGLSFPRTGEVKAVVSFTQIPPEGSTLSFLIRDNFNRILVKKEGIIPRDRTTEISLSLSRTREIYHRLEVLVVRKGRILDRVSEHFYVPRDQEKDLIVWTDNGGINLIGKRRRDIFREYGITTLEDNTGFARMIVSDGLDVGLRYWITHCDPFTGGCISSPTYGTAISETFEQCASLLKPYGGKFISTGDDSGVNDDFCGLYPYWVRSLIVKFSEKYNGDHRRFAKEHGLSGWGDFAHMAWNVKLNDIIGLKLLPGEFELFRESWKENYKTIVDFNRASGTEFKSFNEISQADLSKIKYVNPCLFGFQNALKEQYQTISVLNNTWGSNFSSFEDVTEEKIQALTKIKLYGALLDKKWYLEDLFIKNMASAAEGVKKVSSDIGIGQGAASFGNIIPEVLEHLDSAMPYKGQRDLEVIRSVPHRYSGHTIGVYGGKAVSAQVRENEPWHVLFTGGNFIWFWSMITGGLEGDLSMNPNRSGIMLENIREMQNGIARALIQSKRQHDGIAILHSRRSGSFSEIMKDMGAVESSQVGFQQIIEDLGMQYRYTWTKEVEEGVLRTGEFRVLILPYAQILSEKEVEEIKHFVAEGGLLIADLRPGTHNWNGKPLESGVLDEIFGVKINGSEIHPVKDNMIWRKGFSGVPLEKVEVIEGVRCDASVKPTAADSLASVGDTPVVFFNTYGRGKAILLNLSPTTYNILLNNNHADAIRKLYREIFELAGAHRRFKIVSADGQDIQGAEIAIFKKGPIQYLTVEKYSYEYEKYPITGLINLDGKYEVYNTREGRKLGWTDKIPIEMKGLGCYVYTLLSYKVKGLDVEVPSRVVRGGQANIVVKVVSEGKEPGAHTIRVDIYRPSGERLWPMYKIETIGGLGTVILPIAYNEELGKWRVVVTDVTTGISKTVFLKVTEEVSR